MPVIPCGRWREAASLPSSRRGRGGRAASVRLDGGPKVVQVADAELAPQPQQGLGAEPGNPAELDEVRGVLVAQLLELRDRPSLEELADLLRGALADAAHPRQLPFGERRQVAPVATRSPRARSRRRAPERRSGIPRPVPSAGRARERGRRASRSFPSSFSNDLLESTPDRTPTGPDAHPADNHDDRERARSRPATSSSARPGAAAPGRSPSGRGSRRGARRPRGRSPASSASRKSPSVKAANTAIMIAAALVMTRPGAGEALGERLVLVEAGCAGPRPRARRGRPRSPCSGRRRCRRRARGRSGRRRQRAGEAEPGARRGRPGRRARARRTRRRTESRLRATAFSGTSSERKPTRRARSVVATTRAHDEAAAARDRVLVVGVEGGQAPHPEAGAGEAP